jgi:hypothetical protein
MADSLFDKSRTESLIEYYKQSLDRRKLRANLAMSADERWRKMQVVAKAKKTQRAQPPSPDRPWESISDCSPHRTSDPVIELYKRDIDRSLLRENLRRSTEERCQALVDMARLVDELRSTKPKAGQTQ